MRLRREADRQKGRAIRPLRAFLAFAGLHSGCALRALSCGRYFKGESVILSSKMLSIFFYPILLFTILPFIIIS
jgi:hypothetical protein